MSRQLAQTAEDSLAAAVLPAVAAGAEDASLLDERFAKRRPAATPANITHPSLPQPMAVVVRDCSSTGARLELVQPKSGPMPRHVDVPKHFTLNIPVDRSCVECEVAWHCGTLIGVRYISPTYLQPRPARPKAANPEPPGSFLQYLGFGSARSV